MTLRVSRRAVRRVLIGIVLTLTVASFVAQVLKYHDTAAYGLVPLFDGDAEANIPTFYSAVALLACAVLLYVRAAAAREATERHAQHWMVLAAIFLLGAVDEAAGFHELANQRIAVATGVSTESLPWVLPASILVLALVLSYRQFARDLAGPVRHLAVLGGGLLVLGALGLEPLEAISAASDDKVGRLGDGLISTVQELFEMLGVVFILDALLLELSRRCGSIRFRLEQAHERPA